MYRADIMNPSSRGLYSQHLLTQGGQSTARATLEAPLGVDFTNQSGKKAQAYGT